MTEFFQNMDREKIPRHLAIIMDGNGRWAKSKDMPRAIGHRNGVKSALSISKLCANIGIEYLTLYTLSIENLKRPKLEINSLMALLSRSIKKELENMKNNNIQFNVIGFRDNLPNKINSELDYAISETKDNNGMKLFLALAYSAREELINCTKLIAEKGLNNELNINDITKNEFTKFLLTSNIPDPDLLIRTGSENRLSNFLLWQCAYTELYFSEKFWPDFEDKDLFKAINDFQNRDRRYGKIKANS